MASAPVGVIVVECMCCGIKCVCVVESMYVLWNLCGGDGEEELGQALHTWICWKKTVHKNCRKRS